MAVARVLDTVTRGNEKPHVVDIGALDDPMLALDDDDDDDDQVHVVEPKLHGQTSLLITFHVVFSTTFSVPELLFKAEFAGFF